MISLCSKKVFIKTEFVLEEKSLMQDVLIQNSFRNKFINFSNAKVRSAWIKSQGGTPDFKRQG